ncbi:MAG: hypothetical protein LAT68_11720 [Cyclobacteriaceae bacterium]|nr:hypothetical protein [Cyclobacteriaceae bacterium]MCH8516984.1 hypothetical protein [Cyclobacteriaceae bacterium]
MKTYFFISLLFISLTLPNNLLSNNLQSLIYQADSLFASKKFTQAIDIYETIYNEEKSASPQMLLKMAYIKEGLGDLPYSIYYLGRYYQFTRDQAVLKQMNKLANEHNFLGYEYQDRIFFLHQWHVNKTKIQLSAFVITLLLFLTSGYLWYTQSSQFKSLMVASLSALFLSGALINVDKLLPRKGVVIANSPIMTEASAASGYIKHSQKGHLVTVKGNKDNWYRIEQNGVSGYIRKHNLRKW